MDKQGRKRPLDTPKRMRSRRKSSENLPSGEIKREERLITKILTLNYEEKLSAEIMTRNYQLVYNIALKCVNCSDTGVSKNHD